MSLTAWSMLAKPEYWAQVYSIRDSPLCLTGTAEVPLGGMYMDRILSEAQLPIRMTAFGHCFRTEAGSAGAAGKGLYRVHQFSKVGGVRAHCSRAHIADVCACFGTGISMEPTDF